VKKKMTKATYICRSAKKKVVTYFILFLFLFLFLIDFKGVFWAFRNKGSSKTRKTFLKKSISAHPKKCGFFFLRFFFFSLGCFVRFFFNRVFGRFVTRGVQKRHKKKSAENLLSFQIPKKALTHLRRFFCFVFTAPLGSGPWTPIAHRRETPKKRDETKGRGGRGM
jgi:hypothetical protein